MAPGNIPSHMMPVAKPRAIAPPALPASPAVMIHPSRYRIVRCRSSCVSACSTSEEYRRG